MNKKERIIIYVDGGVVTGVSSTTKAKLMIIDSDNHHTKKDVERSDKKEIKFREGREWHVIC